MNLQDAVKAFEEGNPGPKSPRYAVLVYDLEKNKFFLEKYYCMNRSGRYALENDKLYRISDILFKKDLLITINNVKKIVAEIKKQNA